MHAGNLLNEPFPFHTRAAIIHHWYPLGFYIEDHKNIISVRMSFETRLLLQTWAKYRVTAQKKRAEEQCRAPRRMCCWVYAAGCPVGSCSPVMGPKED